MKIKRSVTILFVIRFAVLTTIFAGVVNCKGKGDPGSGTSPADTADPPSVTTPDRPVSAEEPAASVPAASVTSQLPAHQDILNEAALNGDLNKMKEWIGQGADPNGFDQEGRTPLMFASFNGQIDIVRLLLEAGADPGIRDAMGRTALLYASTGPFAETVKLLLDHQADPNVVDSDEHFSPLMHAAAEGQLEVVRLLLESGADPMLKDIDGETAALFARNNGHTEVAGLIQSVIDSR